MLRWQEFVLFGACGLGLEVIFTGIFSWAQKQDRHLMGYSSIWYLPLYGLIPLLLDVIMPLIGMLPIWGRGLLYMLGFFFVEYLSMGFLRWLLGTSPSEGSYKRSRWHVNGLIRLDFGPAFFFAGLLFEALYRHIRT